MFQPVLRAAALFLLVAATAEVSWAQPGRPNSPPPDPGRAVIKGDRLLVRQSVTLCETLTRTRKVMVDGKAEEQTYSIMCPRTEQRVYQAIQGNYRVMTVGGQRLSEEQVAERLSADTDVLVSTSGKVLDPAYQALYLPETLIVYLRHPLPAPPSPATPPAPGEPPPPTRFPDIPLPKGQLPVIGFAMNPVYDGQTTSDDKMRISTTNWRPVYEERPVQLEIKDTEGNTRTVTKMQAVTHWLGQGSWIDIPLSDLALIDGKGTRLPAAARSKLIGGITPVLLMLHPDVEIDSAHLKHFRAEVPIVQADLPPAPALVNDNVLPQHETLAQVRGDRLTLFKPISEWKTVKVPVASVHNGQSVTIYETKAEIVTKLIVDDYNYSVAGVKATDAAGRSLDAATLATRLAAPAPVLVWGHGVPSGQLYLAPLKPDTLTLVLPAWEPPASGVVPPSPTPAGELPNIGMPPRFALAQFHLSGNLLVLREGKAATVDVPKTVSRTVDGKAVNETLHEQAVVVNWRERAISPENYRLLDCSGQPLDEPLAMGRLNKETMVLISDHGKKLDPVWLAIYKPETVIVYLRPQRYGGDVSPAPAPVEKRPSREPMDRSPPPPATIPGPPQT